MEKSLRSKSSKSIVTIDRVSKPCIVTVVIFELLISLRKSHTNNRYKDQENTATKIPPNEYIITFLCHCSRSTSFLILQYVDGIIFSLLRFRTDRTVKHIEVLLDETTQKYRVKDESDAVSYANFLQFDSIQQLLDQCKQHASKMGTVLAYDELKSNKAISRPGLFKARLS